MTKDAETLSKRFNARLSKDDKMRNSGIFNGFEHPHTPIITCLDPTIIILARWGLIPTWANATTYKANTLNAQIETLSERPSYAPYLENRCLILADGFYEWQWLDGKGKRKQKFLITRPHGELYAYAGIFSVIPHSQNAEPILTYSIITTQADVFMAEIHNTKKRMPVILSKENELDWLNQIPINEFKNVSVELQAVKVE